MRRLIWLPVIIILSGCAQGLAGIKSNIQTDLKFNEILLKDVRQAKLLADNSDDELAIKCWTYIEEFAIANTPSTDSPTGKVVGVLSAYQRARNIRRTVVEVKISNQFRLECGPMLTDTMGTLGRLGIRIAL